MRLRGKEEEFFYLFYVICSWKYITAVAARSKPRNVFARSNTGIVLRISLKEWMNFWFYTVFVLSCVDIDLATG
jgi:hypothetical protein